MTNINLDKLEALDEEVRQLRTTIERVRSAITLGELSAHANATRLHGSTLVVSAVLAALDGEQ